MDFKTYAEILSLYLPPHDQEPDEARILDSANGFAAKIVAHCQQLLEDAEDARRDFDTPLSMRQSIRLERDTWNLAQVLYGHRRSETPSRPTPSQLIASDPHTPPTVLLEALFANSPILAELHVVQQWLQATAPPPPAPSTTIGYRKFTLTRLEYARRSGKETNLDGMVRTLHPDAVGDLAKEDDLWERGVVDAVFKCLRSGQTDLIPQICQKGGLSWLSAVIRGGEVSALVDLPPPSKRRRMSILPAPLRHTGNPSRSTWKSTVRALTLSPTVPAHLRSLYSALSPSSSTLHVLLSSENIRTFEDHLWARVTVLIDERWESVVGSLENRSWKGADRNALPEFSEEDFEMDVRNVLEGMENIELLEGPPSGHTMHTAQLSLILARIDTLCANAVELFGDSDDAPSFDSGETWELYVSYLRFYTHLVIMLNLLKEPLEPQEIIDVDEMDTDGGYAPPAPRREPLSTLILAYLSVLSPLSFSDRAEYVPSSYPQVPPSIIAMYTALLPRTLALETYGTYLSRMPISVLGLERIEALSAGRERGIRYAGVYACLQAVHRLEAFDSWMDYEVIVDGKIAEDLSEDEEFAARALEWVVNTPETYGVALHMGNKVIRWFLLQGKPATALDVLGTLPGELLSQPQHLALPSIEGMEEGYDIGQGKTEYLAWKTFSKAWFAGKSVQITLEDEVEADLPTRGDDPDGINVGGRRGRWLRDYRQTLETMWEETFSLVTGGWLHDLKAQDPEYVKLRKMYIPLLIRELHHALVQSRRCFPKNHKKIFELVNLVADRRYGIHEDFLREPTNGPQPVLEGYLNDIKDAALLGIEKGGNDPFVAMV